ncbi:uncharacterized protein BJX67DRAFT_81647 [Aspergillus lucknowensis]|uniref:Uncharacterized protein n=1 Tax=Aspergillus lucknowensis TaxID=176173 RepID=A0ABR4LRZ2_9EURO
MNWTGGRLRRHSEIQGKPRKQTFGRPGGSGKGPHQITLFNSFAKARDTEKGGLGSGTSHGHNRSHSPLPHPSNTMGVREPSNRLEQMKRRLLETTDWGAVGAARPVQVSFTPREDLERFGKRRRLTKHDHERLNSSTTLQPRCREQILSETDLPEGLEIRINGHRLGQQETDLHRRTSSPTNDGTSSNFISSQSMLLDHENSMRSHNGVKAQDSFASTNSTGRSGSKMSMLSNGSQICYISDLWGVPDSASARNAVPYQERTSSGEPMVSLQSPESSSIIPQPESLVRRRFTIDDQAVADREGRFMLSSPMLESPATQLGQGRVEASSSRSSSREGDISNRRGNVMEPNLSTSSHPCPGWLAEPCRGARRADSNEVWAGSRVTPIGEGCGRAWPGADISMSGRDIAPTRIFGQPPNVDFDILTHVQASSNLSDEPSMSPPLQFWSKRP